jgi:hypothetical protein
VRRILVVVGLVVLLAAAIVVPAMAQDSSDNNLLGRIIPKEDLAQALFNVGGVPLLNAFGLSTEDIDGSRNASDLNASSSDSDTSNTSTLDPSDPDAVASQEFSERRIQSGSASPSSSFSNTGDNVNACPTTQQVVNTGNVANQQGVVQYNSTADDVDLTGSSITVDSSVSAECTQSLDQAAAGK